VRHRGGAYTSHEFKAVCARLQIHHEAIESTKGESWTYGRKRAVSGNNSIAISV